MEISDIDSCKTTWVISAQKWISPYGCTIDEDSFEDTKTASYDSCTTYSDSSSDELETLQKELKRQVKLPYDDEKIASNDSSRRQGDSSVIPTKNSVYRKMKSTNVVKDTRGDDLAAEHGKTNKVMNELKGRKVVKDTRGDDLTILAGQRLYLQALKRSIRLEEVKQQAKAAPIGSLVLETRKRKTRDTIKDVTSKPRYLLLYEYAKVKEQRLSETSDVSISSSSSVSSKENLTSNRHIHLYNLSNNQQAEGKKRRDEIKKKSAKAREIPDFSKRNKISPQDADKLYYRGIKQLVELDNRNIKIAKKNKIEYKPLRFREDLREKVVTSCNDFIRDYSFEPNRNKHTIDVSTERSEFMESMKFSNLFKEMSRQYQS